MILWLKSEPVSCKKREIFGLFLEHAHGPHEEAGVVPLTVAQNSNDMTKYTGMNLKTRGDEEKKCSTRSRQEHFRWSYWSSNSDQMLLRRKELWAEVKLSDKKLTMVVPQEWLIRTWKKWSDRWRETRRKKEGQRGERQASVQPRPLKPELRPILLQSVP